VCLCVCILCVVRAELLLCKHWKDSHSTVLFTLKVRYVTQACTGAHTHSHTHTSSIPLKVNTGNIITTTMWNVEYACNDLLGIVFFRLLLDVSPTLSYCWWPQKLAHNMQRYISAAAVRNASFWFWQFLKTFVIEYTVQPYIIQINQYKQSQYLLSLFKYAVRFSTLYTPQCWLSNTKLASSLVAVFFVYFCF